MFRKMLISFFLLAAFSGVAMGASASYFLHNAELDGAVTKAITEVDAFTIFQKFEPSSVFPLGFMQCELQALFSRILPLILENPLGESNAVDELLLILKPKVVADTWDSRTSFAQYEHLKNFSASRTLTN